MNEHYKIIVAGYNCFDYIEECFRSIENQTYKDYDVCLVDDASTDRRLVKRVGQTAEHNGWKYLRREENAGPLRSQYEGIQLMNPSKNDVVVWVDMDDAFASPQALEILDCYYDSNVLMTYGSYTSYPFAETCSPAVSYPEACLRENSFRDIYTWGIRFNHLRTVRFGLFDKLDPEVDFKKDDEWLRAAGDSAIMIPCLEMAGRERIRVIPDVLYRYTSANPLSEWRKRPREVDVNHAYIAGLLPKEIVSW